MYSKIKTALKAIVISIVLFVAIVLIINTSPFDEELNPEVQKIMQEPPMPVVDGNAYYAIYGINAKEGKDISEAGHELTLRYIENRKNGNDGLEPNDYDEILGEKRSIISARQFDIMSCDFKSDFNCLSNSSLALSSEALKNPSINLMLNKYENIINMPMYSAFEDITLNTPLNRYRVISDLSRIKIIISYKQENRKEFITNLYKDTKFWKVVLNQGNLLIDKMMANAMIKSNIYYLSEYIRKNEIQNTDNHLITELLKPLTENELDLSQSFLTESRTSLKLYDDAEATSQWYENLIFQPNATINDYYEKQFINLKKLANLSIPELVKVRGTQKPTPRTFFRLHYLYNYLGKTLNNFSLVAYTDYIIRGHDLNNIIKMVNIQFQVKKAGSESIQDILKKPNNLNLYAKKPFQFNASERVLEFECLDKYSECKIKL